MRSAFRLPERLSLRARLLVLLVVLAAVGLATADFASYRALHNYLYGLEIKARILHMEGYRTTAAATQETRSRS